MGRPKGHLESECGVRIENRSQAIVHAAECCSVGRVSEREVCGSCGQTIPARSKDQIIVDLREALEERFDDGSSVMAYVLATRPDLAARLRTFLGA